MNPVATIFERITIDPTTGCWLWPGATQSKGYGSIGIGDGRTALVHRVTFGRFNGPIPDEMTVDHLCRNKLCCNPSHLELVTNAENIRRGNAPSQMIKRSGMCKRGLHPLDGGSCKRCDNLVAKANRIVANENSARREALVRELDAEQVAS